MNGNLERLGHACLYVNLDHLPSFPFSLNEGTLLWNGFVTVHVKVDLFSSWIAVVPKHYLLGGSHVWQCHAGQVRQIGELARNAHSLLASTRKLDRPAARSLWGRWSSTTYSPGDRASSSLMRTFADSRSFAVSKLRKHPSGFFFRMSKGECIETSCVAWCCKAN